MRIGLLLPGRRLPRWQAHIVRGVLARGDAEVRVVFEPARRGPLAWRLFERAWLRRRSRELAMVDLRAELAGCSVASIEELPRVDVVLDLVGTLPLARLAGPPRLGVWRYRWGDRPPGQGLPPGAVEVARGEETTCVSLVSDAASGASELRSARLRTARWSITANADRVCAVARGWPGEILDRAAAAHPAVVADGDAPGAECSATPGVGVALVRQLVGALHEARNRLLRHDQWTLGVAETGPAAFLDEGAVSSVRWMPERRGGFLADPHGVVTGGGLTILAEDYSAGSGRGQISWLSYEAGRFSEPAGAISESTHLSYPYLVEDDGAIYCIPEAHQSGRVTLYRAVDFPSRWQPDATLIEGRRLADATVLKHEGRWWLWASDEDHLPNTALWLWHASELRGPWLPHPGNPVKIDVTSSRPAGTPFVHRGRLYRPAQDSSRTYGGRVAIMEVSELSLTGYSERVAAVVSPPPGRDGLHTLSAAGGLTLLDTKRLAWHGPLGVVRSLAGLWERWRSARRHR